MIPSMTQIPQLTTSSLQQQVGINNPASDYTGPVPMSPDGGTSGPQESSQTHPATSFVKMQQGSMPGSNSGSSALGGVSMPTYMDTSQFHMSLNNIHMQQQIQQQQSPNGFSNGGIMKTSSSHHSALGGMGLQGGLSSLFAGTSTASPLASPASCKLTMKKLSTHKNSRD